MEGGIVFTLSKIDAITYSIDLEVVIIGRPAVVVL